MDLRHRSLEDQLAFVGVCGAVRAPATTRQQKRRSRSNQQTFELEIHEVIGILAHIMNCKTLGSAERGTRNAGWERILMGVLSSLLSLIPRSAFRVPRFFVLLFASAIVAFAQTNTVSRLSEPDRVIHVGDMIKITLRQPDRAIGSLEAVQKIGDVATPDGSYVKADGLTLLGLRTNLANMYRGIIGYEEVKIEASIHSSPYKIVKYDPKKAAAATHVVTQSEMPASGPPATLYPRIFKEPITLWQAIELEGGLPKDVNPRHINILKRDLKRSTFDCSGKDGAPDGKQILESGDYIFLVPESTPLSGIFE